MLFPFSLREKDIKAKSESQLSKPPLFLLKESMILSRDEVNVPSLSTKSTGFQKPKHRYKAYIIYYLTLPAVQVGQNSVYRLISATFSSLSGDEKHHLL
jgi:hypothetical protein